MLSSENIKEFLAKYVSSINRNKLDIPPQFFFFTTKHAFPDTLTIKYFDQHFLNDEHIDFWSDIVHFEVHKRRSLKKEFDGVLIFGVMADSEIEAEADYFFGVYVYHEHLNVLHSYVFDLDFKLLPEVEVLDLFFDKNFSDPYFVH